MSIKAQYFDDSIQIEADEQRMIIPCRFMSRFVSCVEAALYRHRYEKIFTAKKLIVDAHHPDILPFVEEQPPGKRPQGRPKDIHTPKKQKPEPPPPNEPEPPPFRHTPFR